MSKLEIARRMRAARRKTGLTQSQVAKMLGVSAQAISNYERGTNRIDSETLSRLCQIYGMDLEEALGAEPARVLPRPLPQEAEALPSGTRPFAETAWIPLVGAIPAGQPALAEENIEGYRSAGIADPENYFFLKVRGDSMVGRGIQDGDEVLLRRQSWAENGQVVACRLNGEEATLKRFKQMGDIVLLMPENTRYEPRVLHVSDFDGGEASILGVAVEVRHPL